MIPERKVVAVQTAGPHDHIVGVKLEGGAVLDAKTVRDAIEAHAAHYVMSMEGYAKPVLLYVKQCPDCLEDVLWA